MNHHSACLLCRLHIVVKYGISQLWREEKIHNKDNQIPLPLIHVAVHCVFLESELRKLCPVTATMSFYVSAPLFIV